MTAKAKVRQKKDGRDTRRLKASIRGAVQGVGFRPFVYRLAKEIGLTGWVVNSPQGVSLELEGQLAALHEFASRLRKELPPNASIHSMDSAYLDPVGHEVFEIRISDSEGPRSAVVLPDIAICDDCRREILDPEDRRFGYPFTNCTNCGPRYSIILGLPYDRPNTSMRRFDMCEDCIAEYTDPLNRRFHAQPNACPVCGPSIAFTDATGRSIAKEEEALKAAAKDLLEGRVVAVKGLGGFHLMADARNDEAVRELRHRKHREEKPLAVMVADLKRAKRLCEVFELEETALTSPEAPIVILRQRPDGEEIAELVAPGNPNLGVMLAYTPLHTLLLNECGIPLVATSGNVSDEPICTDENEAFARLKGIADSFLVHDRPIVRPIDDSVVRVIAGQVTVVRRARGYAPLPVLAGADFPNAVAVGAHMKSAVAASGPGTGAVVGQHIGDLDTEAARRSFERSVRDITDLYGIDPEQVACDAHPDYFSTSFAESLGVPVREVQHHHAHILSCVAENEIEGPVFGIAWDGTGYGTDGTVWGGEFLLVDGDEFERAAHLRQFRLPGGERAVKEPRRSALGVLHE
ncbi:MAG: carbamoyltransferase HypF, partial [Aridibacter famidurans]|nr:carbamoyltransferase HypF [Aridibacter famidurans]